MAANKLHGIRAALCHDELTAEIRGLHDRILATLFPGMPDQTVGQEARIADSPSISIASCKQSPMVSRTKG